MATAADKYTIKDIRAIAVGCTVESLNNNGQLAGAIPVSQTRNTGWWFDGRKIIDLGTCGGIGCRAMDINDKGQIVGNIGRDAFVYHDGKFVDLAAFVRPPGIALAVNDLAEAVGWYTLIPVPGSDFPSERHAYMYRGRTLTALGTLGGKESSGQKSDPPIHRPSDRTETRADALPPVGDWIFEVPNLALKKASRAQGINLSIASLSVILCNFRTATSRQVLCHSVVHPVASPQPSLAEIPRPAKFALITQRQVIAQRKK